ncbi:MAG TPA: insulinase family protein [Candidatus Dojkabacteria bacterium]|nr:insulinase family protein [Candidatus Dojkabacteria bacterium]
MKLIRTLKDPLYDAVTNIYELPRGTKVVHTLDAKTVETAINIVVKVGDVYDIMLNLPHGTSHFLEHMLSANPNSIFKTKDSLDKYKLGNLTHAPMYENASTGYKTMYFWGTINSDFEDRLMKMLYSYIIYPTELFSKYIEKERKIIIAERNGKEKQNESENYAYYKQLFKFKDIKLYHNGLGEIEDIKSITTEHLQTLYKARFSKGNVAISIQSNQEISPKVKDYLYKIDEFIQKNVQPKLQLIEDKPENKKNIGAFKKLQNQGVRVELGFFEKYPSKVDYKERAALSIINMLLSKVNFEIMREKLGLIYSSNEGLSSYQLIGHVTRYISYVTDLDNVQKLINRSKKLLHEDVFKFIHSKKGQEWFASKQSSLIYPFTKEYDNEYATGIADTILAERELVDMEKFVKQYKNIKIEDVVNVFKNKYLPVEKYLWIVSDQEPDEILKKIKY